MAMRWNEGPSKVKAEMIWHAMNFGIDNVKVRRRWKIRWYIYIYIYIIRKWDRYEMGLAPVAGEFPAQRASNADNVSIWWRHHPSMSCGNYYVCHAFVPLLYQAWCVHSGPTYFTVLLMAFISRTQFGYTLILQLFRHIHPSSKVTGFFFAMYIFVISRVSLRGIFRQMQCQNNRWAEIKICDTNK